MASSLRINSLTRMVVQPAKKLPGIGKLNELFVSKQSRPIRLSGVLREETIGWAPPAVATDIISDRDSWDLSHSRVASGFLLSLRVETRRVPNSLVQYVVRDRIAKKEAKRQNPVSRSEKREILTEVKKELGERGLPTIKTIDGLWHTERSELWIFSTSSRAVAQFEHHFRETFGRTLDLDIRLIESPAFSLLAREKATDGLLEKIATTIPSSFTGQAPVL